MYNIVLTMLILNILTRDYNAKIEPIILKVLFAYVIIFVIK